MKGTGIQTDPYLIETWDDFFDMTKESEDTYYMLANDLDGNDYNGGVFGYNNEVHANIDGNGKTIRNLYYLHEESTAYKVALMKINYSNGVWKNLTIENVQTNVALFLTGGNNLALTMKRCRISVECYAFTFACTIHFIECTVEAKLIACMRYSSSNDPIPFERCSINCRITNPTKEWQSFGLYSSRLEMRLDTATQNISSPKIPGKAENSVLAISLPDGMEEFPPTIVGSKELPSVLDATLWGNAPTSGITDIIMLPTESMKNADALNAAGFTVVRVS